MISVGLWFISYTGLCLTLGSFWSETVFKMNNLDMRICVHGSLIWLEEFSWFSQSLSFHTLPQLSSHWVWQSLCIWAGSYKCGCTLPPFFPLWGIGRPFSKSQQTPFSSSGAQTITWRWPSGWSRDRMKQIDSVKRGRGWMPGRGGLVLREAVALGTVCWMPSVAKQQQLSSRSLFFFFLQFTSSFKRHLPIPPPPGMRWARRYHRNWDWVPVC